MDNKIEARMLLQRIADNNGWAYSGDHGECIYCGASGDMLSKSFHREACIIEEIKTLVSKMLVEE